MKDYVLGVDLGGTKIAVAGSNRLPADPAAFRAESGSAVEDAILRVPSLLKDYSSPIEERLLGAVRRYVDEYEDGVLPSAVGFGLKDHVDRRKGIWYAHETAEGRVPLDMRAYVAEKLSVPVVVLDNDVHTATEGEVAFGAGRKYRDFLYINIGTGIAMGAVIDGQILSGAANYAGEIGHISVDPRGDLCTFCGQRGCYEDIACGEAIIHQARKAMTADSETLLHKYYEEKQYITSHDVFRAADQGDAAASAIADRVYEAILISTCGMINLFNPEAVIFGGGVMADGWVINKLNNDVPNHIIATDRDSLQEISLSGLGSDHVGVLGAVALAMKGR